MKTSAAMREQARLALPLVLGQLGQQLMGLVDTAMLGRYSDSALAGAGIANSLLFGVTIFGMGVVMGLDALVPQAIGAGDEQRARRLMWHGVRTSVLVGLPLTGIAAITPLILPLAGVGDDICDEATVYLLARLPAVLPFLIFVALRSYLQAKGITLPIVIAMVAGNLVNVAADGLLIFGDRALVEVGLPPIGLPALGVLGAAIATSIISVLGVVVMAIAVQRVAIAGFQRGGHDRLMTRAIFRLGMPIGLQLVAEVGIFAVTAVLAGRLGTIPAAAHQVALTLASVTFSVVVGVGAATSVMVGRAVGAADATAARGAGIIGILFGTGFMSLGAVVFVAAPELLAGIFTSDPLVLEAAIPLIRIAAVFQLSDGIQAVAAGALRGAGDTRSPLYANLAGHYLIALPLSILLGFQLELGAIGLWWGLSAGLTTVAILLLTRFLFISARPIARV